MQPRDHYECELAVIGAGVAGMAASLFASNRGLCVAQVGGTGGILFASGYVDLCAVYPVEERRMWSDPWKAIEHLRDTFSSHPYVKIPLPDIRTSLDEYLAFMTSAGIPYVNINEENIELLTPVGTTKQTYRVPNTMWNAVPSLNKQRPCLIVDFHGFKEFNASLCAGTLKRRWPVVRAERIRFPGTDHMARIFSRHMALNLERPETLEALAERIRPLVRQGEVVGVPAVLGIHRSPHVVASLQELIGTEVFEIPTLPASVPGFRLKEAFEQHLAKKGIKTFYQSRVIHVESASHGRFVLHLGNDGSRTRTITAQGVILATGRFFGRGLYADRSCIREAIFDLPVWQPSHRSYWHWRDPLDPRGHEINQAGLEVDEVFRPVDASRRPVFPLLFAVGSILAHQDWMRMKCGSGVAIASAYAAVKAFCTLRG